MPLMSNLFVAFRKLLFSSLVVVSAIEACLFFFQDNKGVKSINDNEPKSKIKVSQIVSIES